MRGARAASAAVFVLVLPALLSAQEASQQPYIDQIKGRLDEKEGAASDESYIQAAKRRFQKQKPEASSAEGYTEKLRKNLQEREQESSVDQEKESYTERLKSTIEPKEDGGAIQAVREGRSELRARISDDDIRQAAGFKVGAALNRTVTTNGGAAFENVYGDESWFPSFSFFYEYQPWHSEWLGNFGITGGIGFTLQDGSGAFAFDIPKPTVLGGGTFGTASKTDFRFITLPIAVGLNYRFNLLRILRPYVQAAGVLTVFHEGRTDDRDSKMGNSRGFFMGGGVNLLLDWFSAKSRFDLYTESGIKHSYLTFDYTKEVTFSGPVDFSSSAFSGGLTFEF